jgi:hypothetical protein
MPTGVRWYLLSFTACRIIDATSSHVNFGVTPQSDLALVCSRQSFIRSLLDN